jgi:hypothetical protein
VTAADGIADVRRVTFSGLARSRIRGSGGCARAVSCARAASAAPHPCRNRPEEYLAKLDRDLREALDGAGIWTAELGDAFVIDCESGHHRVSASALRHWAQRARLLRATASLLPAVESRLLPLGSPAAELAAGSLAAALP